MKIVAATIFALQIPFVEAFAHSIRHRAYSDAIVVRVVAAGGTVGYGEAIARPPCSSKTIRRPRRTHRLELTGSIRYR